MARNNKYSPASSVVFAIAILASSFAGIGCEETCEGDLCVSILSSGYSTDSCGDGSETCDYANVWFMVTDGGDAVGGLDADEVALILDGVDYGSESGEALCPSTELRIRLLLDRSFSIHNAGNVDNVREGADRFLQRMASADPGSGDCEGSLGAQVATAVFASESDVPVYCSANGFTGSEVYLDPGDARDSIGDCYVVPTESTSNTFTSLHDAVLNWSSQSLEDDSSRFLPVMVAFTDGHDTSSDQFQNDAAGARGEFDRVANVKRLYLIAFKGDDVVEADLRALGDDAWIANEPEELDTAFDQVADELARIYRLRILVPERDDGAAARLDVRTVSVDFTMGSESASNTAAGGCNLDVTTCEDTCPSAGNGVCEDGSDDSSDYQCEYGTDCSDCGARPDGFGCSFERDGRTPARPTTLLALLGLCLSGLVALRRRSLPVQKTVPILGSSR